MNRSRLGIIIIIFAIIILGVGIGLKYTDSEINTTVFTVSGLVLNSIGLIILKMAKKKED